jgi:hypothetical protein
MRRAKSGAGGAARRARRNERLPPRASPSRKVMRPCRRGQVAEHAVRADLLRQRLDGGGEPLQQFAEPRFAEQQRLGVGAQQRLDLGA